MLTSKGIMYINPIDLVWLLIVKLGAVQSTYMAKLEIENWSAAYNAHIVRIFRRLSCAHGSASYHAHSAVDGAEIPQSMVRKFRTIGAFPLHIMRFPQVILRFRT